MWWNFIGPPGQAGFFNGLLGGWEAVLHEYAIQPMQQFAYSKGKNATDMALLIDAMDLLYTKHLEGIALVSSDSDFTPLVMRLRANGLRVYGFGEEKTPMPFVNACSRFLYLEKLGASPPDEAPATNGKSVVPPRKTAKELKCDTKLMSLLRNAVASAAEDNGWANLAAVGSHISKQASFDQRNYGFAKLGDLFSEIDLFTTENATRPFTFVTPENLRSAAELEHQVMHKPAQTPSPAPPPVHSRPSTATVSAAAR